MTHSTADVVICGAGIAGISAAYHLAVRHGMSRVVIVDQHAPLALTSAKSNECYRNWWPGPGNAMVNLMNRSIDIMEELAVESDNFFNLNRRGYLYATAHADGVANFRRAAEEASALGAGTVRYHPDRSINGNYTPAAAQSYDSPITGADLITDRDLIEQHFPYVTADVAGLLHVRRAGWFSGQQLGMYLLRQAQEHGVRLINARVEAVSVLDGHVDAVQLGKDSTTSISTRCFVNAAGPFLRQVGHMLGLELPVFSELHTKMVFRDHLAIVARDAPLLIWTDPVLLPWSDEERRMLGESDATAWLLEELPPSVHARPEGGVDSDYLIVAWTWDTTPRVPEFPLTFPPNYAEIAMRGMARMIPGLSVYFERLPKAAVDGGYYTKTRENRPLIGPLPVEGAYVIGALSGFGLQASSAAGELLAAHITNSDLPEYAPAFTLQRYQDPAYRELLDNWDDTGQI